MYRFINLAVGQYMTSRVHSVSPSTDLRELQRLFEEHDFNAFPVVDNDQLVGVVTKFDFLRAFAFTRNQLLPRYAELMDKPTRDVMTEAVISVRPGDPLTRTLQLMINARARSFPVVDRDERLIGMIAREDIMRALRDATTD